MSWLVSIRIASICALSSLGGGDARLSVASAGDDRVCIAVSDQGPGIAADDLPRLFVPFDARIGRKLSDNASLSFELGIPIIKDYPVYNLKTQVRLNVTY